MPELDFLVIGDHVRPEGGVFNILAAGIDRVFAEVPGLIPLGLAARLVFNGEESTETHSAEIRVVSPSGTLTLLLRGEMRPSRAPAAGLPDDWPLQGGLGINMFIPVQEHGVHTLTLLIDGEELKALKIIIEPPQEA